MTNETPRDDGAPGYRGRVEIDFARCGVEGRCVDACPTPALTLAVANDDRAELTLDLGQCVFCGLCEEACPSGAIRITGEYELAVTERRDLLSRGVFSRGAEDPPAADDDHPSLSGSKLAAALRAVFGRPMRLMPIDAGSCNGCEIELRAAMSSVHDLPRYGVQLVSSPRQADVLLVTGPVTAALEDTLAASFEAMAEPRRVIALGACAIGGGIFAPDDGSEGGVGRLVAVDVFVPGCPPRPQAIAHGLLLAMSRSEQRLRPISWRGPFPDDRR